MPTGTVAFKDGATPIGTATLVNGVADLTVPLPAGNRLITATYSGDVSRAPSSASLTVRVWYMMPGLW
jgi:hypothetical protein